MTAVHLTASSVRLTLLTSTVSLLAVGVAASGSSIPEACVEEGHRQFDFFLGEWSIDQEILQSDGSYRHFPARSTVTEVLQGCALLERWEGVVQFYWQGMTEPDSLYGISVRAYDPDADLWSISWMDSRTPRFGPAFSGRFAEGRGEFLRAMGSTSGRIVVRITFSEMTQRSFQWALSVTPADTDQWSTLWRMHFTRPR